MSKNDYIRLKELDLAMLYEQDINSDDLQFALSCLQSPHQDIVSLAGFILSGLNRPVIVKILEIFTSLPVLNQKILIPYLVTIELVEPYVFLLDFLREIRDKDMIDYLCICIAKTDYFIFPLILARIDPDAPDELAKLRLILSKIGFFKLEPYLAMLPYIPHEQLFRDLFGDERVEGLKV